MSKTRSCSPQFFRTRVLNVGGLKRSRRHNMRLARLREAWGWTGSSGPYARPNPAIAALSMRRSLGNGPLNWRSVSDLSAVGIQADLRAMDAVSQGVSPLFLR